MKYQNIIFQNSITKFHVYLVYCMIWMLIYHSKISLVFSAGYHLPNSTSWGWTWTVLDTMAGLRDADL